MKIAVVGAGIAGLTTAYQLHRYGHEVEVFEKDAGSAMECSHANGGQISVCNSEVWTKWSTIWQGLKWSFKDDAPLLIRKTPELDKILWLAGFLLNTAKGVYEDNTIQTIRWGLLSRIFYKQIIQDTNIQFDQSKCGILHVYDNENALLKAGESGRILEQNGVEWDYVTRWDIINLDPAMQTYKGLIGGFYTPSDWTGDVFKFCTGLADWLKKQGVTIHYDTPVCSVVKDKKPCINFTDKFDAIVLANGHEIKKFALSLGEWINVYPVKGYSITIQLSNEDLNKVPKISIADGSKRLVTSRLGNRFRLAGTAELGGVDTTVRPERIQPLRNWVYANFPDVSLENTEEWACLRPMSSDMMPIVRESRIPGIWYHGGHGHLGWTLSALTSKLVALQISNKK